MARYRTIGSNDNNLYCIWRLQPMPWQHTTMCTRYGAFCVRKFFVLRYTHTTITAGKRLMVRLFVV